MICQEEQFPASFVNALRRISSANRPSEKVVISGVAHVLYDRRRDVAQVDEIRRPRRLGLPAAGAAAATTIATRTAIMLARPNATSRRRL